MNYTSDDILVMFEDVARPAETTANGEAAEGYYYSTTACPYQCASMGGEDYWC